MWFGSRNMDWHQKLTSHLKYMLFKKGCKYWADLATSAQRQLWCWQTPFISLPYLGIARQLVTTMEGERAKWAFVLSVGAGKVILCWVVLEFCWQLARKRTAFSLIPSLGAWQAVRVCIGAKFGFVWGVWFNFFSLFFSAYQTACLASVLGAHWWWDVEVGEWGRLSASGWLGLLFLVYWLDKFMLSHSVFVCCVKEIS
jgi:hypothetical protein